MPSSPDMNFTFIYASTSLITIYLSNNSFNQRAVKIFKKKETHNLYLCSQFGRLKDIRIRANSNFETRYKRNAIILN